MKKIILSLLLMTALTGPALADPAGKLGLGVVVGSPIGPTMKYWLDSRTAVDFGIGFDEDPVFYADFLWHNWNLTPKPTSGQMALYAGVGPRYEVIDHHEDEFGLRVPFGLSYFFDNAPIELYGEIVPVFVIAPDTDAEFDGGVGVRFYLGR
jgi:hypothetical protein